MKTLPAAPADADAGVNVTAESITVFSVLGVCYIMRKNEITDAVLFINNGNARFVVPVTGEDIVVATDKLYRQTGKIIAPAQEKIVLFIGMTMKHIADNDQLLRTELLDKREEPLHVFLKNRLWYIDSRLAKMPGLAQVQIR